MNDLPSDKTLALGAFESVSLPGLGIDNVIAKVDTGAYSGAVHCESIKLLRRRSNGVRVLRFVPSSNHTKPIETTKYTIAHVRSSSGHRLQRYLIETDIIIRDKRYTVTIGLADRSDMRWEVLIGRRFLRSQAIVVDVRINQELDTDGGEKL